MCLAAKDPSMPLEPGSEAPDVTATNQHGESVSPDFDAVTVVYFYVEDETPGCATQADQFTRESEVYADADVTVYGVSTDGVESHRAFADENDIEFDLLADPDGELCDAFGVERDQTGRAKRTTFVVEGGKIVRRYDGVNPDGHARDLLMDLYDEGIVELES